MIKDFIRKKKSVIIKWKKQTKKFKAGYKVQYSKDKKFKKGVKEIVLKKASSNYIKLMNPKTKRTYYIRVKGYNKYGDGKWSKPLKFSF